MVDIHSHSIQQETLCFYTAWNNHLWSQSSSGGRGSVLEHILYINYLILVMKQKLLSLFCKKLKCGSKVYCTPQGLCSCTVAGSELVAWLWDCPSDIMSTIYSMPFLSIVPPNLLVLGTEPRACEAWILLLHLQTL